jgi:hypothetical protein
MNFELSDEQRLLQEAARDALSRQPTVAAAREALDGSQRLNLWDTAREAGWPGLMVREDHGGAGLGALDAMLVAAECGRVLAGASLLGHVPATALLDAAAADLAQVARDGGPEPQVVVVSNDGIFADLAASGPLIVLSPGVSALSDRLDDAATDVLDLAALEADVAASA